MASPRDWTCDDVASWLRRESFHACVAAFQENAVCGQALLELTTTDLTELGVSQVGPRRRLFVAIEKLRVAKVEDEAPVKREAAEDGIAEPVKQELPDVKQELASLMCDESSDSDVEIISCTIPQVKPECPVKREYPPLEKGTHPQSQASLSQFGIRSARRLDAKSAVSSTETSVPLQKQRFPQTPPYRYDQNSALPADDVPLTCDHLDAALEAIQCPQNFTRGTIVADGEPYFGFTLGLVPSYRSAPCLSSQHEAGPNLTKILTRFARQELPGLLFSSAQVGIGAVTRLHTDSNNTSLIKSAIIKTGEFTGGELFVYDQDGPESIEVREVLRGPWGKHFPVGSMMRGHILDCRNRFITFDGTRPHMTMPLISGKSKSVVFFTNHRADIISASVRENLSEKGFTPPPAGAFGSVLRCSSDEDDSVDEDEAAAVTYDAWLRKLRDELIHRNVATSLNNVIHAERRQILLLGECQSGKGSEKVLWAFEAFFTDNTLPIIMVKNDGGHESALQIRDRDVADFNTRVARLLSDWEAPPAVKEHFRMHARLPGESFEKNSMAAQVLIRLANRSSVEKMIQQDVAAADVAFPRDCGTYREEDQPVRITFLWDEADLCTGSSNRNKNRLEKTLFHNRSLKGAWEGTRTLWDAVQRNVLVTATICMPALTWPEPFGFAQLPIPESYCGHTAFAPNHPIFKEVDTNRVPSQRLRPGLEQMMEQMHKDSESSTGLILADTFIRQHRDMQEAVVAKCEALGDNAVVVVHNSGRESTHGSAGDSDENRWALSAMVTKGLVESLCAYLRSNLQDDQWKQQSVAGGKTSRFALSRTFTLRSVLTRVQAFASSAIDGRPLLIYVITGQSGGRAVSFRDESGKVFVKHMFYHVNVETASGEHIIQTSNRISACHTGSAPEVYFWTSRKIWESIKLYDSYIHELWDKLRCNLDQSPKKLFEGTELESAKRIIEAGLEVRPTRGNVGKGRGVAPGGLDCDFGSAPKGTQKKGGINVTNELATTAVDLDAQDLASIAVKYYNDVLQSDIVLMDDVLQYNEWDLPEAVRKEIPAQGPLIQYTQEFKTSLREELFGCVPEENPRSAPRFHRAGKFPLWVKMKDPENKGGNDYYRYVWVWDFDARVLRVIRRRHSCEELANLKAEELAKVKNEDSANAGRRYIFVWRSFEPVNAKEETPQPARLEALITRLAFHKIVEGQQVAKHRIRNRALKRARGVREKRAPESDIVAEARDSKRRRISMACESDAQKTSERELATVHGQGKDSQIFYRCTEPNCTGKWCVVYQHDKWKSAHKYKHLKIHRGAAGGA